MTVALHLGDCLEYMRGMEAGSVDAVVTDLPYFGIVSDDWDNQWKSRNEYLDWVVSLAHEWKRITKHNSSIFLFCDEKMEAYIQVRLDEIFLLLNKIVWFKRNNLPQKNAHLLRTFAPMTERALFYENFNSDSMARGDMLNSEVFIFEPIRKYLDSQRSGYSLLECERMLGWHSASVRHCFIGGKDFWRMPTREKYGQLQKTFKNKFQKDYDDLLFQYKKLQLDFEALRRPFNADTKTWDVIEMPIIGGSDNTDHPTTKPLSLMSRVIAVITEPGQVVLDCCMGSGTTGVAAVQLGRNFIGCEIDPTYYAIAEKRIKEAQMQMRLEI